MRIPGYLLPGESVLPAGHVATPLVKPAAQAAAPSTVTVTTNSQNQLVDQSGNVMTDQNGNPVQFSGHTYRAGPVKALLALTLLIGVPAFVGSYFGSRKG